MNWFEALILGLIQGLTEFLPVSSSGHLEIAKSLFGIDPAESFYFTVAVHGATVLGTIAVFRKEIFALVKGLFGFRMNEETSYILKIIISMIPVGLTGFFLKDWVEGFFNGNVFFIGMMLLVTSVLLAIGHFVKRKEREITWLDSFIIGVAQAVAVIPGISRSGATIATGLMLGNRKDKIAKFSFLMVLIPVIGANFIELFTNNTTSDGVGSIAVVTGFLAAFVSGYFACKWMIDLVRKSKMIWFAIYCAIAGLLSVLFG
ncbi:MAG: UDP-diphosphatase [Odoribacter sp.]|nr:UDP-diphosphatase [Odoribacter sp.]